MNLSLRLCLWNANGLANHNQELQTFICQNKIDILLISETHFTNNSYFKIPKFSLYTANHPNNTAHGGSAVLIRSNIKHYELPKYQYDHIQAASIVIEDWSGPLTVSAVYSPPRHNISSPQYSDFFVSLGNRFLAGGDYNAKHTMWGSRLINPRGRQLLQTVNNFNMNTISTGEPTYWPSDPQKVPDLLDFFITKGISNNYLKCESSLDLHSDHSPIILTISSSVLLKDNPPYLCNKYTDWDLFRQLLDQLLNLKVSLKSGDDIDNGIELFNLSVQDAARKATPTLQNKPANCTNYPVIVKQKIAEKRRLRRIWQISRNQIDKTNLNRASQQLKRLLKRLKNEWFQEFSSSLTPLQDTNYSLWKVTKSIKQPKTPIPPLLKQDGSWAKSDQEKANTFAEYFQNVFKPNPGDLAENQLIINFLDTPNQLTLPIVPFKPSEVKHVILSTLSPKKAPGHDLITGEILKQLSRKGFLFLTMLINAMLRLEYFPSQWKLAHIIVIAKPGKPKHETSSYRPISLLPLASKIFEKLIMKRLIPLIHENYIIPDHQFGFRQNHSTIEQVHRLVAKIAQNLETKKYCSAAFLDVQQAFDKVWHEGLLFKIKSLLPHSYYNLFKSYLQDRHFQVKYQYTFSPITEIQSGVPQGSVLGPLLYVLFTSDLPISPGVTVATFADDTALLASHENPAAASTMLQNSLNNLSIWLKKWRIKVNENKSAHLTCTLRSHTCPPVSLNNIQLPQVSEVKYLGMHIDRRLSWKSHVWNKRLQLNTKYRELAWLLNNKSHLSTENKITLYKAVLKPIWTYGLQLWGCTSNSNIEIIQRFQSKILRNIFVAPWYVNNNILHQDARIPFVKKEISRLSSKYIKKLENHPNHLALTLLDNSDDVYRLKRHSVLELQMRF